jgi:hypothetical protein
MKASADQGDFLQNGLLLQKIYPKTKYLKKSSLDIDLGALQIFEEKLIFA